jgi:hypothetical protein
MTFSCAENGDSTQCIRDDGLADLLSRFGVQPAECIFTNDDDSLARGRGVKGENLVAVA